MINLAGPKPTKRLSASLSALAVFAVGPQAVMQRKVLPPNGPVPLTRPTDAVLLPSIGAISGRVTWKVGQVAIPTPATNASIQQVLQLRAVVSDNSPAAAGQAAPFHAQRNLPNLPNYGMITTTGDVASVAYTISGLPQATPIRIDAAPNIVFENNIPIPVRCSMSTGLEIKNYNFKRTVMMITDHPVGSPGNSSDSRQRMAGRNAAMDRREHPLPPIGTISGTVSWKAGEIPVPKTIAPMAGSTQVMLGLAAWATAPSSPESSPFPGEKKVGTAPQYGQATTVGNVVSVPYTIRGLPQGVTIQVRSGTLPYDLVSNIFGAKCYGPSNLEVKNYNFTFKSKRPVGPN